MYMTFICHECNPLVYRVGDGTVPLAIVIYIDGSFIKNKIAVKPIYITVRNLSSAVSGKSMAWRILGMLPALEKKPTVGQSNAWRAQRRLGLHHACMKHVVDSVNRFCSADTHLLCADGQVIYNEYDMFIPFMICVYVVARCVYAGVTWIRCAWTGQKSPWPVCVPTGHVHAAGALIPNSTTPSHSASTGERKMYLHSWMPRGNSYWTTKTVC